VAAKASPLAKACLLATVLAFVLLGVAPKADRFTWFMENLPVLLGAPVILLAWRRFPLTDLLCALLALHALVLMVGGHWTYAEVPAGHWVKDAFHLARNPYDRLGHLMQGFVPVLLFREVLFRKGVLRAGGWSVFVLLLMVLGLSSAYELLEWQTAVWSGSAADAFLGTQGDVWDTQWDMACAGIGAVAALLLLARLHDQGMARLRDCAVAP
jgi:putative membrane protein